MTVLSGDDSARERRRERADALVAAADLDGADGPPTLGGGLQAVCRATTRHLSLWGAVINLISRSGLDCLVASSDKSSQRMGELPFNVGEGPCLDAFAQGRPVLVPDLAATAGRQWFAYASAALGLGVGAVFAIPLHVGAVRLGVLEAYSDRPRGLEGEEIAMLLNFAVIGTELLLDSQHDGPDAAVEGRLSLGLDHRAEVYQAQGMVMVEMDIDLAEALIRMRARAFSRDALLIDVARDIIAGHMLPQEGAT